MSIVPPSKPAQKRAVTESLLRQAGIQSGVALVGIPGYYLDTMGAPGKNDRGIYDDAIILVSPSVHATFNANTDPSSFRPGIATLKPGLWSYKLGIHGLSKPVSRQYEALVQAAPVTVLRDKQGEESGWFGINIHRGSYNSTSSLGCQTIYPAQWAGFLALVKQEMARAGQTRIPYLLISPVK